MTLVLFDIDGTLLDSGGAGRAAMVETGRQLFGVKDLFEGISFSGSVDLDIVHRALTRQGIEPTDRRIGRFRHRYERVLRRSIHRFPASLCPGVEPLLDAIEGRTTLGLQTGNFRTGARVKLERCDLWRRFQPVLGGFGGGTRLRDDLVLQALRQARRRGVPVQRIVVLGDTPADVSCSRAGLDTLGDRAPELLTIAVCTGFASRESLRASRPDLLVEDLEQGRDEVLEAILSSQSLSAQRSEGRK